MASNNNNNIILVILIVLIVVILCINLNNDKDEKCNVCNENFDNNKRNKTRRVNFKPRDNVKYFDKKQSPVNISDVEEYQEKNQVEEFDYNIENFTESNDTNTLNLNVDSTKLVKFEQLNDNDSVAVKFNKLLGNVNSDVNENNLKLAQGVESTTEPVNIKSTSIYNNSLNTDKIDTVSKFKGFTGNGYRSL
jgi:hypothetical protein